MSVKGWEEDGDNINFKTAALLVDVLAGEILVKGGERDGSGNGFDAVALLGFQLCFDLLAAGDQDFMASPASSDVELVSLASSLFQHTATQVNSLK